MTAMPFASFLDQAARVQPSARQLGWFDTEFYAFIHFGINTYTDREWGLGNESPALFRPDGLDCDQWVAAVKAAGCKGLVLTAKHHDGFCLWPSRYTEHSVKCSPWRNGGGDVVREAAEACRRGGIKFGLYLSPWDRNAACYGSDAYNDYYKAQLTELLTGYGELFMVWFDGACGEGPNGRKQEYDFPGYIELIRRYQPGAVIFNDRGPDLRWVGNEAGTARASEWAVVPGELCPLATPQTGAGPWANEGHLKGIYNSDPRLGELDQLLFSQGLCFCGAEMDMSIRPGWFYHEREEPHSLERLFQTYLRSVGGNCCLNLNVPPTPEGRLDARDVARLGELGASIRDAFGHMLPCVPIALSEGRQGLWRFTLPAGARPRYLVLEEALTEGQRIESFSLSADLAERPFLWGTTVGHKRICALPADKALTELYVQVHSARGPVRLRSLRLYGA